MAKARTRGLGLELGEQEPILTRVRTRRLGQGLGGQEHTLNTNR